MLKKDRVTNAESFIELAASRSTGSGKPYLVRAGSAEPVESGAWFRAELERYRDMKRLTANKSLQPTPSLSLRSSAVAAELYR